MTARPHRRPGVAAVETAVVLTFLLVPLLIGIWEMGRVVQVQQIVANSAREGARLAAQARTINSVGTPTLVSLEVAPPNAAALPNVKAAVVQTLVGAGLTRLTWADVDVQFRFMPPRAAQPALINPVANASEPHQGVKNQPFEVKVTLNQAAYNKCKWIRFGIVNPQQVTFTARWQVLVDEPFETPTFSADLTTKW